MKTLLLYIVAFLLASTSYAAPSSNLQDIATLREVADSLHSVGRTDSAAIIGSKAIELAERSANPTQIVGTHAAQGVFLRSLGRINEALQSYEKALDIITSGKFRENPDQEAIEEIASLYINLAVLNLDMQNKEEAAKNAEFSGEWISKSNDAELKSTIFGVVGSVLTGCGELEKAMRYQDLAYSNALASDNDEGAFRAAAYTMLIADRLGNKANAQNWREKCQALMPGISSTMALLVYYQAECSICLKNGRQREALGYFDKILNLDGIDNLPFVKFDCYNNRHIAYAELGDYANAYNTLLKSNELRDSIWQREKTENLRDLTIKYETKETELALAKSEAKRATTLMWLFGALTLLLLIVALFIIYIWRQRRQKMQREIEFANLRADIGKQLTQQYLEGLETERKRMARELHDGVCNDLLAIEMNLINGYSEKKTEQLVSSCREAVRRISHELMPPEFTYATIDEVINYYVSKQPSPINITYTSEAEDNDWNRVPDDVSLELYRIVQEAVGNAIKHSFGNLIAIKMSLNNSILTLNITDNGTPVSVGKRGLGVESMKRRANAINASFNMSQGEDGTCITVSVKI